MSIMGRHCWTTMTWDCISATMIS